MKNRTENNLIEYVAHKGLDANRLSAKLQSKFLWLITNGLSKDANTLEELANVGPSDAVKLEIAQFLLTKDFGWEDDPIELIYGKPISHGQFFDSLRNVKLPIGHPLTPGLTELITGHSQCTGNPYLTNLRDVKKSCGGQLPDAFVENHLTILMAACDFSKLTDFVSETRAPSNYFVQKAHKQYLDEGKVYASQKLEQITGISADEGLVCSARLEYLRWGQFESFRESEKLKPEFKHSAEVYDSLIAYVNKHNPEQRKRIPDKLVRTYIEYWHRLVDQNLTVF